VTRPLAVDLAEYGILVNVVAPGCIHGYVIINGIDETATEYFQEWYASKEKFPWLAGQPEEVAKAILS
jgi:NAD(P)-dependent dehydrogenase (short-subunit alcohol dehydrogenase family)